MLRRSALDNGLRILSQEMPGVSSVSLGIWVQNGSRYETKDQGGISHFLEHLIFKGTDRRTAAQIAEEVDAVGGVLNAFTGKEYTCYYVKVLAEHFHIAQDVLADIFLNSRFDPVEIDRERSVVVQEILQSEDTPDDFVHDLFNLKFWPDHPLGLPICGSVETVQRLQRQDFLDFMGERYRPDRVLVAAAGNIRHEDLRAWGEAAFGDVSGRTDGPALSPPTSVAGIFPFEKPLEQVHVCLGMPAIPQTSSERYVAYVLNNALGGGMSSRLFQEIREKRGRAYSVFSFLSSYLDCGYLGIYVGTTAEWVEEVIEVVGRELGRLVAAGLPDAELTRAKNQIKGNMLLALETSDNHMNRIAKNEIYHGRDIPPAEVAQRIDAVTNDEIVDLAQRLLAPKRMALTLLGDLKGRQISEELLTAA